MIGKEWNIVEKVKILKSSGEDEKWEITYACPIYGGWDVLIECSFTRLQDLDKIVTFLRTDNDIAQYLEETTTLCGTKPNYPQE